MQQNPWARIGVYFSSGDVFALHYREVLDHAGLHVQELDSLTPSDLAGVDVLLLCGYGSLGETTVQAVQDWVFAGGALVCGGSSWGLDAVLGLSGGEQHVSNSTLGATRPSNHWPREAESVRFFGGRLKKAGVCEVLASCGDDLVGLSSRFFGRGLGTFFGVHLGQTIATMQTGLAVECDGIGPGDESARLDDGVLRAEDGIALRFEDRTTVDGAEHPFFGRAHADILKDIWIRSVLHSVDHVGAKVAIFWHWPRHANAVGCLTLDCENFEPEKVALVRRVLIMYGCRAAWLVAMPGYSIDIYRSIKAWDNELGVLFLVDNHSGWHEDKFKIQLTAMSRLAGLPGLTSVRPQDGRWRGWTSFYELCEEAGARISLSKGGRQPGTNGFPFGTCHPFFPAKRDGSSSLVMELPYAVFSPGGVVQDSVSDALLAEVVRRNGCFHVVLRPESLAQPEQTASFRRLLSECKQARVPFYLPEEIYRFERARRQLRVFARDVAGESVLQLSADAEIEGLSILVSGPSVDGEVRGQPLVTRTVERYGRKFTALEVSLQAKQMVEVRLTEEEQAAAA